MPAKGNQPRVHTCWRPAVTAKCDGCGLEIEGGYDACQRLFQSRVSLETSDYRYARLHRLVVDCYCLQHPQQYCMSAKSLMAHLAGLCIAIEKNGEQKAYRMLQESLNGAPPLVKPPVPDAKGGYTIADVLAASNPSEYARRVHAWADHVWRAYQATWNWARDWLDRHPI
ncbi:DUF5946 family protein [Chelatococcus sambhunathii]|uniref:DUF5946 family protein n=1 Tax=Chelatococcus sambhunathii TaxID=363953 RepID=UPI001FDA383B|nr:DUF5946 family protein [Chelatococcus sambhunathii]